MADHDIKLAFIGCGSIAHRHVLAMQDLKQRGRRLQRDGSLRCQ